MTTELVGYKLIDGQQNVIATWGGVFGQIPAIPSRIDIPPDTQVHCPELNTDYGGYQLVPWMEEPPLPDLLPYQFFAQLQLAGYTAALNAFVSGLPPTANIVAQAKLEHSLSFQRNDPLVLAAQAALSISDADLDALWEAAAKL